ncbi:hypothetical protein ACWDV7_20385 [Streptomyces sp. NPDC003362]
MDPYLTILLICLAVLAAACYTIRRLSSMPVRVAAVIMALAALVGSLKPLVELLSEPQRMPVETVAPPVPPNPHVSASVESSVPSVTQTAEGRL